MSAPHGKPPDPPTLLELGPYRLVASLGSTSTGTVFAAERADGAYERRVVVKLAGRNRAGFDRERDALAALDHPNVVKLLDAGTAGDGTPFFVTEQVEGPPIDAGCDARRLSIDDRLGLFCRVCDALQAAHRCSVILGDAGPAHIRLTAESEPKLHLIAPPAEDGGEPPGVTTQGFAFASPEQRRGEPPTTAGDVYALGVLLAVLLNGIGPPVGAAEPSAAVATARRSTPRRLRRRLRGDLDTIVARATAERPGDRYLSPVAIADEVKRHLAGEPLATRARERGYRLGRWAARRWRLVAVATLCALALVAAGAHGLGIRRAAERRLELAQRFGRQGAEIEDLVRTAAMLPRHPMRAVHAEVRGRLARIEAEANASGELAAGPAAAALGRGYLALHDPGRARVHLERAWAAGTRGPDVATALGIALGTLYRQALDESERLDQDEARAAARRQAIREYRDPALAMLRRAQVSATHELTYLEGLIAFYDERPEHATARARAALASEPWRFEALQLEAQVLEARGDAAQRNGSLDEAERLYDEAGELYRRVLDIARSDAGAYAGECGRRSRLVRLAFERGTLDPETVAGALHWCALAHEVDPDLLEGYAFAARIERQWAERRLRLGEDPAPAAAALDATATAILSRDPRSAVGHRYRGEAAGAVARWRWERGEAPWEALDRAIDALRTAVALRPADAELVNALGNALTAQGRWQMAVGIDPRPSLADAATRYEKALDLDPGFALGLTNLGTVQLERARYEMASGASGEAWIQSAIPYLERAAHLNPSAPSLQQNLGAAYLAWGVARLQNRLDPSEPLRAAAVGFHAAAALDPTYHPARHNLGVAAQVLGAYRLQAGLDPSAPLAESTAAFEEALRIRPGSAVSEAARAQSCILAGRWALAAGGDPTSPFADAERALERALALNPRSFDALAAGVELAWHRARWKRTSPAARRRLVEQGLATVRRCNQLRSDDLRVLAFEGALLVEAAKDAPAVEGRRLAERAVALLGAAFGSPAMWDAESFRPSLEEARRLAVPDGPR